MTEQIATPIDADTMLLYAGIVMNCCYPITDTATPEKKIARAISSFHSRTTEEVFEGSEAGKPEDCLELAIRQYTGCGTPRDLAAADATWKRMVGGASDDRSLKDIPRPILARAYASFGQSQWETKYNEDGSTWDLNICYHAFFAANEAASLGFIYPGLLEMARPMRVMIDDGITDLPFHLARFHYLSYVWDAMKRVDSPKLWKKGHPEPIKICSSEGCLIEGTDKFVLKMCAGTCPLDVAPGYCSRPCQRSHWKAHSKATGCKPTKILSEEKKKALAAIAEAQKKVVAAAEKSDE